MNVQWLKRIFSITALGSTLWTGTSAFAGDHRMFPREPQRPHISAACQPSWGYNQTCWQRFPPVAPCPIQCDYQSGAYGLNSVDGSPQVHSEMLAAPPFGHMHPAPAQGARYPAEQQEPTFMNPQATTVQPPIPQAPAAGQIIGVPGSVPALPPLPGPLPAAELPQQPVPAVPNQSRIHQGGQDYRAGVPQFLSRAGMSDPRYNGRYGHRLSGSPLSGGSAVAGANPDAFATGTIPPQQVAVAAPTGSAAAVRRTSANRPVHVLPATSVRSLKQSR